MRQLPYRQDGGDLDSNGFDDHRIALNVLLDQIDRVQKKGLIEALIH